METSQGQIQKRLQVIQRQIRSHGWEALWIVSPANRRYLTGFTGSAGWVIVPMHGKPTLITDGRYREQAGKQCPWSHVVVSSQDPSKHLTNFLTKHHIQKMAFEDEHVTVRNWQRLRQSVPGLKGKNASGLVEAVRLYKDAEEQRNIRKAIAISEKAYTRVLPRLKPGVREIDIALQLEKEMMEAGATGIAFATIVASGPNGAMPHAQPTQRKFLPGDLVVIDFGSKYKGYHSDLTRTVAVARMSLKQREYYKLVKTAQICAQKELVSGKLASEADKKARNIFKKEKKEKQFVHSLGHGIGLEIHESPRISLFSKDRLEKNMIITCEPGLYFPGWGGIRIEDDVLVADKPVWLSQSSEELMVVGRK